MSRIPALSWAMFFLICGRCNGSEAASGDAENAGNVWSRCRSSSSDNVCVDVEVSFAKDIVKYRRRATFAVKFTQPVPTHT